ncbi:discoidin domain-containing protein [Aquabacterium sp. A7-Y]|uniref:galactose-binding domain-containing protein n=1 Tax=Aquabacterium sp. A7-Y TaxID=1349605 RepID=UPI00223D13DC|nr:discoidin domain-containing protein [Aquabacterium sp. A7-Y]MCW7539642.1 discoidin domain-containing protein [Aquabacterium sp. A7-Y]
MRNIPGGAPVSRRTVAVAALSLLLLVGCGGGGGSATDEPSPSLADAADTAPDGGDREAAQAALITPRQDALVGMLPPTPDAHLVGMWSPVVDWPVLGLHANVLPNGRVLTYGAKRPDLPGQKALAFDEWDPAGGLQPAAHKEVRSPTEVDSFCSASVMGPDGLLMIVGGNTFWKTSQWDPGRSLLLARASQMHQPRWYSSLVRLPDNRVVVVGGNSNDKTASAIYATTPEVFSAAEGWRQLSNASSDEAFGATEKRWWYPRAYLAPDGRIVGISNNLIWRLDAAGAGRLEVLGRSGHRVGISGTTVMYRPGKVLLVAGGETVFDTEPASRKAAVLDIGAERPVAVPVAELAYARNYANSLMLPDGRVLVTGGTTHGNALGKAVLPAEVWDPQADRWTPWASASAERLYHSTSLLLPSGAVLNTAGGSPGPVFSDTAQVFFPPYFFRKRRDGQVVWADRPAVQRMERGHPYFSHGEDARTTVRLADRRRIASVALISLAAVTHGHSTDLRHVPVPFRQRQNRLELHLDQLSDTTVPPGYYQLHVVDDQGVPSAAVIVEFRRRAGDVAGEGRASQSSDERGSRAADRATDQDWRSHTATAPGQSDAWWRLDFDDTRPISAISLFNRLGDCDGTGDCRSRLRDITVSVLDAAGQAVWTSSQLNPENSLKSPDRLHLDLTLLNGTAVPGRSVVVQRRSDPDLSGSGGQGDRSEAEVLSLAEVQVEQGPVNLALRQTARQSSTASGGVASRAVDGRYNALWRDGPLTYTGPAQQPWWEVDLGAVHPLRQVRIWNRVDCCSEQLADFDVLVSDTPFGGSTLEEERRRPGVTAYPVGSLEGRRMLDLRLAEGQSGRYVRLWLRGEAALSLAEVEVLAR